MFQGEAIEVNDAVWANGDARRSWEEIDRALRDLAKRRGALDAEEAQLLCAVVRDQIWRELGKASLLEYLEEVLGLSPRAARERVRVALALDELPELADALATGELAFSAIRELTRVATPATQKAWCDAARGKNLRQIEQAVSGRQRGDLPTDPPDPDLTTQVLQFEVRPATYARFRHAQQALADEVGSFTDDDALITAFSNAAIEGGRAEDEGRARYQIMTVQCESCGQGWHEGAGRRLALDEADLARAECDAQRIGSDAAPERAVQDVPPSVRRFVKRRDDRKCCVPGCRASRFAEIHHIVPREAGGSHEPDNLTLLCDGHHRALHEGKLTITGKAPALEVRWLYREPRIATHVGTPPPPTESTLAPVTPARTSPTLAPATPERTGSTLAPVTPERTDSTLAPVTPERTDSALAPVTPERTGSTLSPATPERTGSTLSPTTSAPPRSKFAFVALKVEARQALTALGFSKHEASAAVEEAATHVGPDTALENLLRAALARCTRPCR